MITNLELFKARPLVFAILFLLSSCINQQPTITIHSVQDARTREPVKNINIYIQPEDLEPGEDGVIHYDVIPPIVIPIETGRCTYVLIEAEGYEDWEKRLCMSIAKKYPLEILRIPRINVKSEFQQT